MNGEYIKREDVLKLLNRNSVTKAITFADGVSIYDTIANMPSANAKEVVYGDWIKIGKTEGNSNILKCSNCHRIRRGRPYSPFCPDCGADMYGKYSMKDF